ncbi:polycomb group protein Psc [Ochlerotatus camptorhynchus]|uniref:polycomb group protein Psc n=1 Tax=Ochlerotatus camptorhynchus TaxID=644619 RepID=UPI0031DAF2D0
MTTASALHTNTAADHPGTTVTTTKVAVTVSGATGRTNRRKVKDFNDSLTCSLCTGYLIEATTVNDCLHTFCRSCIVRHLERNKYCPKCKSYNNKTITVANLRPDRILRSLVYKLVPGLHQSENQRAAKFYADQCSSSSSSPDEPTGGSRKPPDHNYLDDQNFFSPDELINLSLEYHYDSIADYDPKKQELPITYLRCPAAVTIHHLYKFILTKNGLQLDNERIQVDIIYEDEILPHEFTLMDVAYCFDYKRSSLMRLYYRIFIHPTAKPTASTTTYNVGSDKNSNENNNNSGGERDANNSTTGRSTDANLNEPSQGSAESSSSSSSSKPTSTSPSKNATGASCGDGSKAPTSSPAVVFTVPKEADSRIKVGAEQDAVKSVNNESSKVSTEPSAKSRFQASEASCYSKYDSKLIITKTNKSDKGGSEKKEKESLKLVLVPKKSDKNDAKIVYSKSDSKASKSPKQSSPSASVSFGDFKRLRSNDIRYSDYETASSSSSFGSGTSSRATSGKSGTVPGDDSRKSESQNAKKHNKINNDYNNPGDSSGKKFSEDNSRNKVYGNEATSLAGSETAPVGVAKTKHEKSKSAPARSESNGAPVAITASSTSTAIGEKSEKSSELKCYVNLKKQTVVSPLSSSTEHHRKEVPKLKIELPSLKTKITIPKLDSEKSPKSAHSSSTSSSAATSPAASTSASGKSPIWPKPDDGGKATDGPSIGIEEYAKTIGLKPVHKISEGDSQRKKKKSSTSSSPDPSFHRKRKKAKHSKEPGGKRRKLHAEISSQQDESLKMKVKLTEKPSKHDRKPSEEITPHSPKEPTKHNAEVTPSSSLPPPSPQPPSSSSSTSAAVFATPVSTPPKEDSSKVIDITKGDDDDDVKIIEHPTFEAWLKPLASGPANVTEKPTPIGTRVNELPSLPPSLSGSDSSTKTKINEMRAIRHKPMVYIPNPDKNLFDNSPTINSLIQSVQAKTGFIDKDNDVQIVSTSKLEGNGHPVSKVPMPPLVPTKPISTVPSMKPPTMIPSTASSRTVSTNSIPKPQQRVTVQSQQVFSPRHIPNYPPLALQSAPKKVINPTTISTNVYQPRNMNPALKRSISVDSSSTYNIPPKTPRVDLMELNAQHRFLTKPIYAPMFNFVKGASLAKNGNPNRLPTSANDVPYRSPISSSYTKEVNTKKPVPSLLLPPSSISVTKMTDTVPQPPPVDNRPALEIVRIPSSAPVADKPQTTITMTSPKSTSITPKTTRPPPPTIPLIKIKKTTSMPEHPTSPISPSVFQVTSSCTNSSSNLSTTCASHQDTSGALDLTTRANDDLIILEGSDSLTPKLNGNEPKQKPSVEKRQEPPAARPGSDGRVEMDSSRLELINSLIHTSAASMIKAGSGMMAKLQSSIPGLKLPPEMIGFAISSPSAIPKLPASPSSLTMTTTMASAKSIPMPKLAEINRNRNTAVRQLNPSVRNIPNPSALAFRNQTIAISNSSGIMPAASFSTVVASSSSGNTITSFSPTSPTAAKIMTVNIKTNNANTAAGQKSSVNNNGISSGDTISSIASLAKANTSAFNTTTNGNGASSGGVSNLNGNNNNNSSSSGSKHDNVSSTSGGGGKKTIEKVAAGLKAAAATAAVADAAAVVANGTNGNRVSSSNGSSVGGGISKNSVNVV